MSKAFKIVILSLAAALVALFVTMFLLCVPIGNKGSLLSISVFYITALVTAILFFFGAIFSLFCRFRGLTGRGSKYYDNTNKSENYKG